MSIQRYYVWEDQMWLPEQKASDAANYMETVVKHADHVAAVAEASRGIGLADYQLIAQRGAEAERARIRAAVEALPYVTDERWAKHAPITPVEYRRHVLAIIDGSET